MKYIVLILGLMFSSYVNASLPIQVSLEKLVKETDHLLVGRVIGVDMIDGNGDEIVNPNARTGPGSQNKIRLIVSIDETIISDIKDVPQTLKIPLDPFMHFSLGQIKEAHRGKKYQVLFLLKGKDFQPPFDGIFRRSVSDKERVVELMKSNKVKNENAASGKDAQKAARPF